MIGHSKFVEKDTKENIKMKDEKKLNDVEQLTKTTTINSALTFLNDGN